MKKVLTKKNILILVISIALSFGIVVTSSNSSVPPCFGVAPECNRSSPVGKLTTKDYGYPAVYKNTVIFEPQATDTYASSSIEKNSYIPAIFVNIFFWFALFTVSLRLLKRK